MRHLVVALTVGGLLTGMPSVMALASGLVSNLYF